MLLKILYKFVTLNLFYYVAFRFATDQGLIIYKMLDRVQHDDGFKMVINEFKIRKASH